MRLISLVLSALVAQGPIRTADITVRGLKPSDFPRITKLAPNVYAGGDLEVYLPREKVLFMSEVFSNRIFPSMANGFPSEWIAALKKAEAMDAAIYVPAHGFIDSPAILKEEERNFRSALERVIAEGRRLHDAKVPVDEAAAKADLGSFAGWTRRTENAAGALKRVYMELDGELTR